MSETRREIVTATMAVLREEGYDALTIQRVADRVGMTTAGVHYHFETREALLVAAVEETERRLLDRIDRTEGPPGERLAAVVRGLFEVAAELRGDTAPVGLQLIVAAEGSDRLRAALTGMTERYEDRLAGLVREGVEQGAFADSDPDRIAAFVASMADAAAIRATLGLPVAPLAAVTEEYVLRAVYDGDAPSVEVAS